MFHQHCCSRAEELEGLWGVLGHCWNQKQCFQGTELFPVLVQKGEASHHKLALRYPQHLQWAMNWEFSKTLSLWLLNKDFQLHWRHHWGLGPFHSSCKAAFTYQLPLTTSTWNQLLIHLWGSWSTCTINGGALTCHWWRSGEWCPHPQSCRRDRDRW